MKKTLFTFASIALVATTLFFACKKDDNDGIAVTYASQASNTTGNSTGTTTGTTTPTNSLIINGVSSTPAPSCSVLSAYYVSSGSAGNNTVNITFNGTPSAGNYPITSAGLPGTGQSTVVVSQSGTNYTASTGNVSVTVVGGKVKASFSGVTCTSGSSNLTCSATLQCP